MQRVQYLDAGLTQKSPHGDCHYVFKVDPTNDFIGSPCLGVDIKHNGYIVLTPSTFEGQSYQVIRDDDITPLPSWLTDKIRKSTSPAFDIDLGYRSGDHDTDEVLKSEIMTGQNWHTNVLKLTGRYVKRGLLDDQIHAIMDRFTLPRYTVPEMQSEVQKMIHGARTKDLKNLIRTVMDYQTMQ